MPKIFDYVTFFRELLATMQAASPDGASACGGMPPDASRDLREQLRRIANTPIWNDRAACLEIAEACEQLGEWRANGEGTDVQDSIRMMALARVRGEAVRTLQDERLDLYIQAQSPFSGTKDSGFFIPISAGIRNYA